MSAPLHQILGLLAGARSSHHRSAAAAAAASAELCIPSTRVLRDVTVSADK